MIHAGHVALVHAGHLAMVHARHVTLHTTRAHTGHLAVIHAGHVTLVHAGHLAMVHALAALHAAVVHAVHAAHASVIHTHVAHGDQGTRIDFRDRSTHTFTDGQGTAGIAGAVHGLGKNRVGLLVSELDNHVVGLGHGDTEFVDADRLDVLTVGGHHCHFQTRNPDVEIAHGRAVNEAQTKFFARLEDAGPVPVRCLAVHEVGVGVAADVGEVGGAHLHFGPHLPIRNCRSPAILAHVVDEVAHGALVEVVVVRLLLELGQDPSGIFISPIRQHHHVIAIITERLRLLGIDDQSTVNADLLLQSRVAVIPIGTVLFDREFVLVHAIGRDAVEAQAGHAIHVGRQKDTVPVN